ncbi:hypothetical protein BsWGS_27340 [Bradybaena similaris]
MDPSYLEQQKAALDIMKERFSKREATLESLRSEVASTDVEATCGNFPSEEHLIRMQRENRRLEDVTVEYLKALDFYKGTSDTHELHEETGQLQDSVAKSLYLEKEALWNMDPKDVTVYMHEEFYRSIANVYGKPRYHLHYKIDAPLKIIGLFYVPEYKPTMFDMSRKTDVGVALYSRKVLIMANANHHVLPKWLRFVKGVVDTEDIPLNVSRELLQDSHLIRKICQVLTSRILEFFADQAKKDSVTYQKFYEDYGLFFREGIVTTVEQDQRENIAKLLQFESSKLNPGKLTSLEEYTQRMKPGERNIYFLSALSRQLAETSPYFEALKEKDIEVLFLYDPYDEVVLKNLRQFDHKNLKSVESEPIDMKEDLVDKKDENSLKQKEADELKVWLESIFLSKVDSVKINKRLSARPFIITLMEMASARHLLQTVLADKNQEERFRLLQPTLEVSPSHPLILLLHGTSKTQPDVAALFAEQLYNSARFLLGPLC